MLLRSTIVSSLCLALVSGQTFVISTGTAVAETHPTQFASLSFDWTALFGVQRTAIPFSNPSLQKLSKNLAPSFIRIGGSLQDHTINNFSDAVGPSPLPVPSDFLALYLNESTFDGIFAFAEAAGGLDIVWGLSAAVGRQTVGSFGGTWNLTNVLLVAQRAAAKGFRLPVVELGNEVNVFNCSGPNNTAKISASELASEYILLADALKSILPSVELWGSDPSITGDLKGQCLDYYGADLFGFYRDWIADARQPGNLLAATTWHWYPQCSCNVTSSPEMVLTSEYQERIIQYDVQARAIRDAYRPGLRMVMGETASFWAGGLNNTSNAFASGFWYLPQLGYTARQGYYAHIRQDIAGANYGLLDLVLDGNGLVINFTANPDYFVHALYKRLVSGTVLDIQPMSGYTGVQAYAHCARNTSNGGIAKNGSIVVIVVNLNNATVMLNMTSQGQPLGNERWDFLLTTPDLQNRLGSKTVLLNGVLLELLEDLSLPPFPPSINQDGGNLVFPPLSYGFSIFPNAGAAACS